MVKYDQGVIQDYADTCYMRADAEVRRQTIKWGIICALFLSFVVFFVIVMIGRGHGLLLGVSIGAISGFIIGKEIGKKIGEFDVVRLRYEGQKALCLMHIKDNHKQIASSSSFDVFN